MERVNMNNKIASLQAQLERKAGRPPAPESVPVEVDASQSVAATSRTKVSTGRAGKVHIGAYLPEGFQTSILAVRAQTREDVQTLLARALNDLFKAHNVPVIDLK
jgi:hypothetical protein